MAALLRPRSWACPYLAGKNNEVKLNAVRRGTGGRDTASLRLGLGCQAMWVSLPGRQETLLSEEAQMVEIAALPRDACCACRQAVQHFKQTRKRLQERRLPLFR